MGGILPYAHADTIWCKMFNAGCVTEEQKQKQAQHCEQMGNDTYREALSQAMADPSIWQSAGDDSAQDYAKGRKRLMKSICFKKTTPQSY